MAKPIQHFVTLGDTRTPLKARLVQDSGEDGTRAIDTNGLTLTFRMIDNAGTVIASNSSNTSQASAVAFTASGSTLTRSNHGLAVNDEIVLTNSGGALPGGLATSTTYFVVSRTQHTFTISTEKGGTAITTSGAGTGTHSYRALGHVQYDFQSADVDAAGEYTAWFIVTESTETDHFPSDQNRDSPTFQVVIKSDA